MFISFRLRTNFTRNMNRCIVDPTFTNCLSFFFIFFARLRVCLNIEFREILFLFEFRFLCENNFEMKVYKTCTQRKILHEISTLKNQSYARGEWLRFLFALKKLFCLNVFRWNSFWVKHCMNSPELMINWFEWVRFAFVCWNFNRVCCQSYTHTCSTIKLMSHENWRHMN